MSAFIGNLIGCFVEFQDIRCAGTILVASWASIYLLLLWDTLDYSIVMKLVKVVIYIIKLMALLVASLGPYSDPIGTLTGFALGFMIGMSLIKKISDTTDEDRKFILLRLKIFIIIMVLIFLIFSLSYSTVMYDKRKPFETFRDQ